MADAQARDDLAQIQRSIAHDKKDAARRWVQRLRDRAQSAAAVPGSGRIVSELGRDDIREVLVGNYRIVYRVEPKQILVLTVFEGHKMLSSDDSNG